MSSFFEYCRGKIPSIVLSVCFLFGMLIGALLVRYAENDTLLMLESVLGGYLRNRQTSALPAIMWAGFSSIALSLAILFFCGFCTIAQPAIILFPVFKGLGYGFSIGLLYARYGASAIGYVALLVLPEMLFSTVLILAACRSSLKMSIALFNKTAKNTQEDGIGRIKRYFIKYAVFVFIALMIAFGEALLCYYFGNLFIF